MTNKEALDELKKVRAINTPDSFVKISNESLDKAIEALKKFVAIENILNLGLGDKYAYTEVLNVLFDEDEM